MRKQTIGAVALALMLVISAGGAMAAAPTLDEETTDTSTQTELDGSSTQPYNESTTSWLNFSADSTNASVIVLQNGTELAEYDNSSSELQHDETVSGTSYYGLEVADDASDYPGLEAGPGEDVDITFRMLNDDELDDPDTTNTTITFANDANRTFVRMGGDDTSVVDKTGYFAFTNSIPFVSNDSAPGAAQLDREDVSVTGEDQDTITMHVAESDARDSVTEVYESTSDSSSISFVSAATYDGSIVPVVAEGQDLPDWLNDSQTYMEVSSDGSAVTVNNAGDALSSDQDAADLNFVANDGMGLFQISSMMTDYGASWTTAITSASTNFDWNGTPDFAEA